MHYTFLKSLSRAILSSIVIVTPLLCHTSTSVQNSNLVQPAPAKDWNWMVYMCNNNNLHRFGMQNFKEMVQTGSTSSLNILLQMDDLGATSIKRFYIEQNNPIVIEAHSNTNTSYSGTPQNLFEFAQWGIRQYPSKHTCLVLWNHGSGIKDPSIWDRMIMRWRDDLFVFNHKTGLLELNRSFRKNKDFLVTLRAFERERGIAFNDAAESYLNNDDLKKSLSKIRRELLDGKKLDILAMDACHMAMVEIASEVKDSVKIIAASEEVEPGAGYDYSLLKDFNTRTFDGKDLAQHIVASYENRYKGILGDYTQSAIDLSFINELESHMTTLASSLTMLLSQGTQTTIKAIRKIRFNYGLSTEFLDSDYIDLSHLLKSLVFISSAYAEDTEKPELCVLWKKVATAASNGITTLKKMIIATASGVNLPEANGLAIYFPASSIHASYYKTDFAKTTGWAHFLEKFISTRKTFNTTPTLGVTVKACCQECEKGEKCADKKKKKHTKQKKRGFCSPCNKKRIEHQKATALAAAQKEKKEKDGKKKPCCAECGKHAKDAVKPPCPCPNGKKQNQH